jgi:hypothetical protein
MKYILGITRTVVTGNGTYQLQNSHEQWEIDLDQPEQFLSSIWMVDEDHMEVLRLPMTSVPTVMKYGNYASEDCQASHCPPSQFTDCQWPKCAIQLDRNED